MAIAGKIRSKHAYRRVNQFGTLNQSDGPITYKRFRCEYAGRIEEELMKAATVLAASGVAFFLRYIRAATQGGIQLGFDAAESQKIAMQTARGAASLLVEGSAHPEMEIDKVTTPQGCTIAGLNEMEHQGLSSALIKGIVTSYERINSITE